MKQSCKLSACLIPTLAVFFFLLAYGCLVHGYLLMDEYKATSSLWRSNEEMEILHNGWILYYACLAALFTHWFKKTKFIFTRSCGTPIDPATCCPLKSGACFGLKIGVLMGLVMASSFLYMPISASLAIKWLLAGVLQGLGVGIILGLTCRKNNACQITNPTVTP